jgi:hypothetical protein
MFFHNFLIPALNEGKGMQLHGISAVSCVPISCVTENIPDSGIVPSLYLRRVPFRALVR